MGLNLTQIVTELRNSNCDNSKTQLGQNSKTPIVTELYKNLNFTKSQYSICDKTQIETKLNLNSNKTQKLPF